MQTPDLKGKFKAARAALVDTKLCGNAPHESETNVWEPTARGGADK
jgi:hypothetical protein